MKPILAAVFLGSHAIAFGNGGGYVFGTPSNGALSAFQPKNAQQIEMQTEDLQIDLHVEFGRIQVEYTLHNPSKAAVTAEIGFPCKAASNLNEGENAQVDAVTPPLRDFTALLDNERLEVNVTRNKTGAKDFPAPDVRGEMSPYRQVPYWYTFKLNFAAGQTRKLRVTYNTDYYAFNGSVSEDLETTPETLTYLFSTAAVWKGPIKQGKVTIRAVSLPADQVKLNLEKRFKRKGNEWTWEFKNFEPTLADDLHIIAHPKTNSFGRPIPSAENPEGNEGFPYADFVNVGGKWSLHHRDFKVTASSTLAAQGENTYGSENLIDQNSETAWVEGANGDGTGEKLQLTLKTPRKVSHVALKPGYCKSSSTYQNNGRVAEFEVAVNDAAPFTATIPDEFLDRHKVEIPIPGTPEVKSITLTIKKVHPGAKHADTAISELELVTPLDKAPTVNPAR